MKSPQSNLMGLVTAAGSLLCLAACGAQANSTGPTPSSSPAEQLAHLIPDSLPSGYPRLPDSEVNGGPADLAQQTKWDLEPGARTRLEEAGFVAGYGAAFARRGGGPVVGLALELFKTAAGAERYAQRYREPSVGMAGQPREDEFTIAGVPTAMGYAARSGPPHARVVATKGPYYFTVDVAGVDSKEVVTKGVQEEFSRLP
jgi:hypothetical protein